MEFSLIPGDSLVSPQIRFTEIYNLATQTFTNKVPGPKMLVLPRKISPVFKVVIGIGLALLFHSAVSCVHFKQMSKSMGKEPYVPMDVMIEAFVGFFVTLAGVLVLAGDFEPAKAAAAASGVGLSLNSSAPSFNIFNHRGRVANKRRKE
jgi:hypothetical protein